MAKPQTGIASNALELRAAWQALQAFQHVIWGRSVMLRLDNTTAVGYIRRQGGTRSQILLEEVEHIISWVERYLSAITATYVLGVTHIHANFLSWQAIDNNNGSCIL